MKAIAFLIIVCLGAHPVLGEASKAAAKPARAKPKIVDLDFGNDEEPEAAVAKAAEASRPVSRESHSWVYWALGATVSAAGGLGGLWLYQHSREPDPVRSEQVFSDER